VPVEADDPAWGISTLFVSAFISATLVPGASDRGNDRQYARRDDDPAARPLGQLWVIPLRSSLKDRVPPTKPSWLYAAGCMGASRLAGTAKLQ
jgi:hypothetical protein